jgi:hypothetical protein
MGEGGPATSTWAESAIDDEYAADNLRQFFIDLGVNAVDVLILSPVYDARDAYTAAKRGDHATAIVYVGFTVCDVAKPCQSILAPTKALRRAANATTAANKGGLNLYRAGRDGDRTRGALENWKQGDWMLFLPNQGSAKANWRQNSGKLRSEMQRGEPISDSYRQASGMQIPAGTTPGSPGRFLNAERKLLESRGWTYDMESGAYLPPQK